MSNPFDRDLFRHFWEDDQPYNVSRRKEIIEDEPPTVDQVVDFAADAKDGEELIKRLYFLYSVEGIAETIGWSKKPTVNRIGGYFVLDFYKKLYVKTQFKSALFAYLPGEVQTDEMLLDYLKSGKQASVNNYAGGIPKLETLEWIIKNQIAQLWRFKKEWWSPKLKTLVVAQEPFAISMVPEDLLTKAEIRKFLKEADKSKYAGHMNQFWKNIPESFRMDPEIFARWLAFNGGLKRNYRDIYSQPFYTLEGMKKYFEIVEDNGAFGDWSLLKSEWKKDLLDVALPKVMGESALDPEIDLTNSLLDKVFEHRVAPVLRPDLVKRLNSEGRLTTEILKKINVDYYDLDRLPKSDLKKIMTNDVVLDYIVKRQDNDFFRKKTNWPASKRIRKEHIADVIVALDFRDSKLDSRLPFLYEDDWVFAYFDAKRLSGDYPKRVQTTLLWMAKRKSATDVSKATLDLIQQLGPDATYESYKAATDIFLF